MKKKVLALLLTLGFCLSTPLTTMAVSYNVLPTSECPSYLSVVSVPLSKVTDKMLSTNMTITNKDTNGKYYYFKFTVPKTSMVNLCMRFKDTPRWHYDTTIFNDATCTNVVYKDEVTDFTKMHTIQQYMAAGDYYIRVHTTYDSDAVTKTFPSKTIDKVTTSASGSSITIKVPNPALYESNDPNIFYDVDSTTKKETFTVNNVLDTAVAYAPVEDMVTIKDSYKNNVCTVTLDISQLYTDTSQFGPGYLQYRKDEVEGQVTYDNPDIWDLNESNWGVAENSTPTVTHYAYNSDNLTGKTVLYLKESGWYSFRLAPVKGGEDSFAVVKKLYVDVTSPTITGVKDGVVYKTDKTVKYSDDSKGSGIYTCTVNGTKFSSGKKFTKDGKYTIKAYDNNKNLTKVKFYIDKKKPVITGVANGKSYKKAVTIKYSDAGSGVYSATLNGKKLKSGTKVSKKGTYVVKVVDKIGRSKTVKFTIK